MRKSLCAGICRNMILELLVRHRKKWATAHIIFVGNWSFFTLENWGCPLKTSNIFRVFQLSCLRNPGGSWLRLSVSFKPSSEVDPPWNPGWSVAKHFMQLSWYTGIIRYTIIQKGRRRPLPLDHWTNTCAWINTLNGNAVIAWFNHACEQMELGFCEPQTGSAPARREKEREREPLQ